MPKMSAFPRCLTFARRPPGLRLLGLLAGLLGGWMPASAHRFPGSAGLTESGTPPFVVLGAETLGMNSPPTDVRLMPDGRLLVLAGQQIALGDGVRWEVFRQAPTDRAVPGLGAAVDRDGRIYLGTPEGAARLDFGDDSQWRLVPMTSWTPPGVTPRHLLPQSVMTEAGGEWFWHTLTGAIVAWRPGEDVRLAGYANTFEHIFQHGGQLFLSERANGAISRFARVLVEPIKEVGTTSAITCAQPFDPDHVLVGTYGLGLQLFDGRAIRPFHAEGLLAGGARINDLCSTAGGYFAAAVDNFGIIFFDRAGHTVQVLDRSLDQRLSRVKRLVPAPGGVVWGLLDAGVLRVEFPARVSHFEALIGAGITTVHPYRHDGELWWLADGTVYRGRYNVDRRLERLEPDGPAGLFANSFTAAGAIAVVGTENGAYYRAPSGWVPFADTLKHLRVLDPVPVNGRWLYCALNEVGWLQVRDGAVQLAERISVPELGNVLNLPVKDTQGRFWLEQGTGRIARVQLEHGVPAVRIFTTQDGLSPSWPQTFEVDGVMEVNSSDKICRFDDALQRFVPDEDFVRRFPGVTNIFGRPGLDARGRMWISADGAVQVFEPHEGKWSKAPLTVSPGFLPYYFSFEDNGVVWMHTQHRLARFDPAIPEVTEVPLRARITRVTLGGTGNHSVFAVGRVLPPLAYAENSLVVNFVAGDSSFANPVTFDLKLDGAGTDWVSNGSAGSAAFNRLKEGRYELHVRPRTAASTGEEATLEFTIWPPWYRTALAYVSYGVLALGALWAAASLFSLLERRKNALLEQLVAERTRELNESNAQLARQVEEIRMLSQAIEQSPVAVFLTLPDDTIEYANPRGCALAGRPLPRLIGTKMRRLRAEVVPRELFDAMTAAVGRGESWRGQLTNRHEDGRILHVRSTISPIRSPDGLVRHHLILEEDITDWLAEQERSRRLEAQLFQAQKMESVGTLAGGIAHDFNNILTGILGYCELTRLAAEDNLEVAEGLHEIRAAGLRAKELVAQILTFSRQGHSKLVPLDLARTVAEALKLIRASTPATIEIVQELEGGTVRADPTQIHQIVVNLCTNAIHAMRDRAGRLEIRVRRLVVDAGLAAEVPNLNPGPCLRLSVTDNGHGMDKATLNRIFDPFYTTKGQGEGTGLGLAIVQGVVASHGGALAVRSTPQMGTTFELYFPLSSERPTSAAAPGPVARGIGQEVLVVDDEEQVSAFVAARLRQFGYRPTVFNDARQALATFDAAPSRFGAVITDLTMPHLTGLDVLHHIRSQSPLLPVLILTGYGRELTGEKLDATPHCAVLQKPFSGDDLARALSQVINPSAPLPPAGQAVTAT